MLENSEYILELLQEYGMVSKEQIDAAREKADASNGQLGVIEALKSLHFIDENDLMSMLAQQYGLETLDLSHYDIPEDVLEAMPKEIARQYKVIPVMMHDNTLTVAMSDPTNIETLDSLRYVLKRDVDAVISPADQIQKIIDARYTDLASTVDSLIDGIDTSQMELAEQAEDETNLKDDAPIIRLVSLIITEASEGERDRLSDRRCSRRCRPGICNA